MSKKQERCKALDTMAYEAGAHGVEQLRYDHAVTVNDPVVRHLLSALLPAMANLEKRTHFPSHRPCSWRARGICIWRHEPECRTVSRRSGSMAGAARQGTDQHNIE
jgi:hypothetical protein